MSISNAFSKHSERYRPLYSVPWGPLGAVLMAVMAVFGTRVLMFFLVAGFVWITGDVSWGAAQASVDQDLLPLFVFHSGSWVLAVGLAYWFVVRRGGGLRELGFRTTPLLRAAGVLAGSVIGFIVAAIAAMNLLQYLVPGVDITAEQNVPFLVSQGTVELALSFIALVVIAPVAEEVIFRGVLLPGLGKLVSMWPAAVLVSIGFGLLHPPLSAMVIIGVFSVFLCLAYMETGSLWPSIILHAGKNLLAFIALV